MNCDAVLKLIPLCYYGELPPVEEDAVEEHLHGCQSCAREMERQRALATELAQRQAEVPASMLQECRADLMATIQGGAPRPVRQPGPWQLFLDAMAHSLSGLGRLRQPLGALALIALGFVVARVSYRNNGEIVTAPSSDPVVHTVRSVQPDGTGHVQISFDETRRKTLSGNMADQDIQRLLLTAAREDNPAVRVESVDVLKNSPGSGEVRNALLNAVAHDPNDGVRLKAVEGLKPLAGDPDVRKTLAQVLLSDQNPAIRMQVVDVLVQHRDDNLVGVLQDLIQKENNNYVRLKSEKALKDMNASIGTF
jgi:hypothetical protein